MRPLRMLYIGDDAQGREISGFLNKKDIAVDVCRCEPHEYRTYDVPSLLTAEGHWRGKKMIENYVRMLPAFASLETV